MNKERRKEQKERTVKDEKYLLIQHWKGHKYDSFEVEIEKKMTKKKWKRRKKKENYWKRLPPKPRRVSTLEGRLIWSWDEAILREIKKRKGKKITEKEVKQKEKKENGKKGLPPNPKMVSTLEGS